MTIHIETHHGNNWLDKLLNHWPFVIDTDNIISGGIGFISTETTQSYLLGIVKKWNFARIVGNNGHLFMNAMIFIRICFWTVIPIGIFLHLRMSKTRLLQIGLGIKNNTGRIGLIFRFQTDASAARGSVQANPDQTGGFEWGFH